MTQEMRTPFIAEDFEPGDRVYCLHGDNPIELILGTVVSVEENIVEVDGDNGRLYPVGIDKFRFEAFDGTLWGKILPIKQLQPGMRVSQKPLFRNEKRGYATITSFTLPARGREGKLILLRENGEGDSSLDKGVDFSFKTIEQAEEAFMNWELED